MPKLKDLSGVKYGKLTVVSRKPKQFGENEVLWICKCDCGNEKIARSSLLLKNQTSHCGCSPKKNYPKGKLSKIFKGHEEIYSAFWWGIKRHAQDRNILFKITIEQVWGLFLQQNKKCALSGLDLHFASLGNKCDGTASLDRIDSSKGYTLDNVQWVHKDINLMKMNLPEEKLIKYCQMIADKSRHL